MFSVLDRDFDEIKPNENWLSHVYNFDSGMVSEDDREFRKSLNVSVKRSAYTFDKKIKAQLRKRIV